VGGGTSAGSPSCGKTQREWVASPLDIPKAPGSNPGPRNLMSWPIAVHPIYGCHEWTGRRDRDGYGRHGSQLAHRAVWESTHGPIAVGLEVEHVCRNRRCVRLSHLELLTRSQQERAKSWRKRAAKATCNAGHDLGLYAIVTPWGGRVCRACNQKA
jgi:hypothetical protein